jgi:hypothetical protein
LLETQWALTSDRVKYIPPLKDEAFPLPDEAFRRLYHSDDSAPASRRPSARERRITARNSKRKCIRHGEDSRSAEEGKTHPLASKARLKQAPKAPASATIPSRSSKKKVSRIDEALATVTTLGLRGRRELLTKEEEVMLAKKMKVGQNLKLARAK